MAGIGMSRGYLTVFWLLAGAFKAEATVSIR